jgi:hypothetical protein
MLQPAHNDPRYCIPCLHYNETFDILSLPVADKVKMIRARISRVIEWSPLTQRQVAAKANMSESQLIALQTTANGMTLKTIFRLEAVTGFKIIEILI